MSILLGQPALIGDLNGLKSLQSFNILEIRLSERSICNICHGHLFDPHLNNQLLEDFRHLGATCHVINYNYQPDN